VFGSVAVVDPAGLDVVVTATVAGGFVTPPVVPGTVADAVTVGVDTVTVGVDTVTVGVDTVTVGVDTVVTVGIAVVTLGRLVVSVVTGVERVTVGSAPRVGWPTASTPAAKKPAAATHASGSTARRVKTHQKRTPLAGTREGLVPLVTNRLPKRESR
jgi:hypothetical protein